MTMRTIPRASATGVSRWPWPGNEKLIHNGLTSSRSSGNSSSIRMKVLEVLFAPIPNTCWNTSYTLTFGGVSLVLRMRETSASVSSAKPSKPDA